MDAKVINHNTREESYVWDLTDVHYDWKGRTITFTNLFGETSTYNLKVYDVMILAK